MTEAEAMRKLLDNSCYNELENGRREFIIETHCLDVTIYADHNGTEYSDIQFKFTDN